MIREFALRRRAQGRPGFVDEVPSVVFVMPASVARDQAREETGLMQRIQMKDLAHHKYVSPFKPDHVEKRLAFRTGPFADAVRKGPGTLAAVPGTLLEEAAIAYFGGNLAATKRFLMLGAEIGCAACTMAFRTGEVTFSYDGVAASGPGGVPQIAVSPSLWTAIFDLVVLSRRKDSIGVVLDYPEDYLRRAGGERDEFGYTLVETLRAFVRGESKWKDLAVQTEQNMAPERVRIAPSTWVAMDRARLGLMRAVDSGSAAELYAALVAMIKAHKAYYGRGAEAKKPGGLLCLPALALAALADDRGIRTTVQSDYMPRL